MPFNAHHDLHGTHHLRPVFRLDEEDSLFHLGPLRISRKRQKSHKRQSEQHQKVSSVHFELLSGSSCESLQKYVKGAMPPAGSSKRAASNRSRITRKFSALPLQAMRIALLRIEVARAGFFRERIRRRSQPQLSGKPSKETLFAPAEVTLAVSKLAPSTSHPPPDFLNVHSCPSPLSNAPTFEMEVMIQLKSSANATGVKHKTTAMKNPHGLEPENCHLSVSPVDEGEMKVVGWLS